MKLAIFCLLLVLTGVTSSKQERTAKRQRRDTVRNEARKWPGGVVPYIFDPLAGIQTRSIFRGAVAEIQNISCVRFVQRTVEQDFVRVITGDGCYSIIGREGGTQDLSLGIGCFRLGIAVHEILHLLGFFHEQSRPDRDLYVNVYPQNVLNTSLRQFRKYKPSEGNTLNEPYDPDSIMHYSNTAFSKNGRETITYKKDIHKILGQRDKLSTIDIRQLNKLYRCSEGKLNTTNTQNLTVTPTSMEVDTCRDDPWSAFTGQCSFYQFIGSCYHSAKRMSYLCPKTCGYCRPMCTDTSEYCHFFSFYGYCISNDVVRQRCKKTCKLCVAA